MVIRSTQRPFGWFFGAAMLLAASSAQTQTQLQDAMQASLTAAVSPSPFEKEGAKAGGLASMARGPMLPKDGDPWSPVELLVSFLDRVPVVARQDGKAIFVVPEGEVVRANSLLFRVDCRDRALSYDIAQRKAERDLQPYRSLDTTGPEPQDEALTYALLDAERDAVLVERGRRQTENCATTARSPGIVVYRPEFEIKIGTYVAAGMHLFDIARLDRIEVKGEFSAALMAPQPSPLSIEYRSASGVRVPVLLRDIAMIGDKVRVRGFMDLRGSPAIHSMGQATFFVRSEPEPVED